MHALVERQHKVFERNYKLQFPKQGLIDRTHKPSWKKSVGVF